MMEACYSNQCRESPGLPANTTPNCPEPSISSVMIWYTRLMSCTHTAVTRGAGRSNQEENGGLRVNMQNYLLHWLLCAGL